MDTRELIQSIIASDEDSGDKFLQSIEERISDALEVRKVELASGLMGEALKPEFSNPDPNDPNASGNEMKTIQKHTYKLPKGLKPQFAAPESRYKMLRKAAKKTNEDVEQVDEAKYQGLSRDTLAKYNVAAARRIRSSTSLARRFDDEAATQRRRGNKKDAEANQSLSSEYQRAAKNRIIGITRATERLAREEVEQVDEAQLTDMQKARIMGMGGKDISSTMLALKRYNKVGDINKLSPAHRTLLNRFMQNQAGGLNKTSTGVQRALLKPSDK